MDTDEIMDGFEKKTGIARTAINSQLMDGIEDQIIRSVVSLCTCNLEDKGIYGYECINDNGFLVAQETDSENFTSENSTNEIVKYITANNIPVNPPSEDEDEIKDFNSIVDYICREEKEKCDERTSEIITKTAKDFIDNITEQDLREMVHENSSY